MSPIVGRYGPFFLYAYTVVLGVGLVASLGVVGWRAQRRPALAGWMDGLLVAAGLGLVAGRAAFVSLNWNYYRLHLAEAALPWQGGLSYHGVLLGGAAGLWLWWRRQRPPRPSLASYGALLAPGLALMSYFGWVACWHEGCAYGRETMIGWLAADLPDTFGVYGLRYQSQLLGATAALGVWLLALLLENRIGPGRLLWLVLLLLSLSRAAVSFVRGDAAPLLGPLRLDALLDLGVTGVALVALSQRGRPVTGVNSAPIP
jgi:prolipoprotein diacylglyceryltransferase